MIYVEERQYLFSLHLLDRCLVFLVLSFLTTSFMTFLCQLFIQGRAIIYLPAVPPSALECLSMPRFWTSNVIWWGFAFRVLFSLYTINQTANGDCGTHPCKINRCWWLEESWIELISTDICKLKQLLFFQGFAGSHKDQGEKLITAVTLNFLSITRGKGVFLVCFWFHC